MSISVSEQRPMNPLLKVDRAKRMAKAAIQVPENDDNRKECAAILTSALSLLGWTNDRFARELRKDPSQTARWQRGEEAYRLEVVWSVRELRHAFWRVMGERLPDVEIVTRGVWVKEIA